MGTTNGSNGSPKVMIALTVVMAVCASISATDLIVSHFGAAAGDYSAFTQQFRDFQQSVQGQLQSLQSSVALIPVETATVTNLQEQMKSLSTGVGSLSGRFDDLRDQETRTRADLDALMRASAQQVPARHP